MATTRKHRVQPFGAMILTGGIGGILSKLFRTILTDIGMDVTRYDALMQRYIIKALQSANRNERAAARIGLSKELLKESMTWKTFIKGFEFLNVPVFEMDLLLNFDENKVARYQFNVQDSMYDHPGCILTAFYRNVRDALYVDDATSLALMDAYIEKTRGGQSKQDKAAARASLNKELLKPAMSWKTFVKGLVLHKVVKFTLFLTLSHRNGRVTKHHVAVALDEFSEGDPNDD